MNLPAKIVSLSSIAAVAIPSLLYFVGLLPLEAVKWSALVGTAGWFLAAPIWMNNHLPKDAREVKI